MSLASVPGLSAPSRSTRTVSGTRSQVRPVANARAMSVVPIPVPKAVTAP